MVAYQGIIFDLDGTLSDSVPVILKCAELTHKKMGLPYNEQQQKGYIGTPLYQSAAQICGEDRIEEYINTFRSFSSQYLEKMVKPFPGIVALLEALDDKGVKMTIVTSRIKWGAELSCKVLGISKFFEAILCIEDTQKHKPDPEPAMKAMAAMQTDPHSTVFVGDSPVDIACGKNAGIATIGVGWGVSGKEQMLAKSPTYFCQTVAELADSLLK